MPDHGVGETGFRVYPGADQGNRGQEPDPRGAETGQRADRLHGGDVHVRVHLLKLITSKDWFL